MGSALRTILIFLLLAWCGQKCQAQGPDDKSWATRETAFEQLRSLQSEGRLSAQDELTIIHDLEFENAFLQTGIALDEGYGEYYANLIASVAGLRNVGSIRALVGAIDTGIMATSALVQFGNRAVGPVALVLTSKTSSVTQRFAATLVFSRMLDSPWHERLSAESIRQMRDALLPSLTDDGFSQRMEAIEALTKLRDTTLLPIFERIAESDSYVEAGTGIRRVRVAAAQAVTVLTKSH
jgi:hypothetical protein